MPYGTVMMITVPGLVWSKKKTEMEAEIDTAPQRIPIDMDIGQIGAYHEFTDDVLDMKYLLVSCCGKEYPVDMTLDAFRKLFRAAAVEWNRRIMGKSDHCEPHSQI